MSCHVAFSIYYYLSHVIKKHHLVSFLISTANFMLYNLTTSYPFSSHISSHLASQVQSNLYTSSYIVWSNLSAILNSATSSQLRINARQWNGNKQSENPPGVKTWRTYHNTVSKPRASLLPSFPLVSCLSISLPSITLLSFPCLSHRLVAGVFVTASCVCRAAFARPPPPPHPSTPLNLWPQQPHLPTQTCSRTHSSQLLFC